MIRVGTAKLLNFMTESIYAEVVSVINASVGANNIGKLGGRPGRKAKGGGKITKGGVKTHQKYPKRGAKLNNVKVTNGKKGMIFQGKKSLEEKLQKNFQGVLFLW